MIHTSKFTPINDFKDALNYLDQQMWEQNGKEVAQEAKDNIGMAIQDEIWFGKIDVFKMIQVNNLIKVIGK